MPQLLRSEIRRAIFNVDFLIAFLIGTGMAFYAVNNFAYPFGFFYQDVAQYPNLDPRYVNAYDAVITSMGAPFSVFVPLLAVMPFAMTLVEDRTSGILEQALSRMTFKRYLGVKILANGLAGGLAVSIPFVLVAIFANVFYPRELMPVEVARFSIGPFGPFSELYRRAPDWYIVALLIRNFFFGAVYATLGLAIASLIKRPFLAITAPLVLYVTATILLASNFLEEWAPQGLFDPLAVTTVTYLTFFGEIGAIAICSLLCIGIITRRWTERTKS